MDAQLPNVHPGEVLRLDFLEPLNIPASRLARDLGVGQTRIAEILRGERSVTLDTALRLGRYFNTTPQLWLNLQRDYDLEEIQRRRGDVYGHIQAFSEKTAA